MSGLLTTGCCCTDDPCPSSPYPLMSSYSDSFDLSVVATLADPGEVTDSDDSETLFRVRFADLPTITIEHINTMPSPSLGNNSQQVATVTLLLLDTMGATVGSLSLSQASVTKTPNFSGTPPYHNTTQYNDNDTITVTAEVVSYDSGTGAIEIHFTSDGSGGPSSSILEATVTDCYYFKLTHVLLVKGRSIDWGGTGEPWDTYRADAEVEATSAMSMTVT